MENIVLIDRNRKVRAKFLDKKVFFFLCFLLINLRYFKFDICRNNQGIVNKKEANIADRPDIKRSNT